MFLKITSEELMTNEIMRHGSLFSGIGGFDLAAEWAGWQNEFHCEISEFPRKILNYYWPKSKSYEDIKKTDFTEWLGRIDIISGGFPCQPYSLAGKRQGKDDARHLWPEMLRVIREVQPRWVVGENVFGLVNWNGGLVFDEVQSDLEAAGYEVQAFILPAASVGAPHRRDRVWFVAYSESNKNQRNRQEGFFTEFTRFNEQWITTNPKGKQSEWMQFEQHESCEQKQGQLRRNSCEMDNWPSSDTDGGIRCKRRVHTEGFEATDGYIGSCCAPRNSIPNWHDFPTQSPICSGNDGVSPQLDGITFSKWRSESIKGFGNAIVPQVAYQIFKTINEYEHRNK